MTKVADITNIFEFKSYKDFVNSWIKSKPKGGYGQYKKISEYLNVGSVLISQIFKGDRDLSQEQAVELSEFLGLLEIEKKYFITLVRFERAATHKLKKFITAELIELRRSAGALKKRLKSDIQLSEQDKARFFSNWQYSAIRLASDIPNFQTIENISKRFDIEKALVKEIVDFLVQNNLCILNNGKIQMGPQVVYLEAGSPSITSRQRNWRLKGFQRMEKNVEEDLFFTCPIVCSKETIEKIKQNILKLIEKTLKDIKSSPSEELACLNIDWFKV